VVEADESDGSFARLSPWAVLLTNIDADHLDQHGSLANIVAAFGVFLERLQAGRVLVYNAEDARIRPLIQPGRWDSRSFGTSADADVRVEVLQTAGEAMRIRLTAEGRAHELECGMAGAHNALNLAGVYALALAAGVPEDAALRGLSSFRGVARRQQFLGSAHGCRIFDDYAHHPTEVRATLEMFRENYKDKLTVVFQPHLYTRTAYFAEDFADALRSADRIILTEIYGAREAPKDGVSSQLILEHLTGHPDAAYLPDWRELPAMARAGGLGPGLLVTMGAGDITGLGPLLLAQGGDT
jgi:UDP-N-acetylmuramate--alanine ligase